MLIPVVPAISDNKVNTQFSGPDEYLERLLWDGHPLMLKVEVVDIHCNNESPEH